MVDIPKSTFIPQGANVLQTEAEALLKMAAHLDSNFDEAIQLLLYTQGRVVVSGIGKSAIIAQKMTATFNSTGTPALFLHAAEAVHGDLGMVQPDDIVICVSKSGDSPEIMAMLPLIKNARNKVIALCGNKNSFLVKNADCFINCSVEKEACPNNLAPTTSTTAQLAMGDALAVCLLKAKGFSSHDFARFHPGGILGKKLYLRLSEIIQGTQNMVNPESSFAQIVTKISSGRQGAVVVLDDNRLVGIITDGDIRRAFEKFNDFNHIQAFQLMNPNPKCLEADTLASIALDIMNQNKISQIVVTQNGHYAGMVHIHDLHREGIL